MRELLLLGKRVLIDESPALIRCAPDERWTRDFEPLGGRWRMRDGYLYGSERENAGGILLTRASFSEDVMLVCRVSTVAPATRDVNVLWCAEWDENANYLARAYIAGLNGWYDGKSGIERFPENGLNATTPLYRYEPGREVELIAGSVAGHCFLAVDGRLVLEMIDPRPMTGGRVGFSPYCTSLRARDIEVRKVVWETRAQKYEPEFSDEP